MKKLILMNQARLGQLGEWLIGGPLVPEHKLGDTRFRFDFYFPNPRVALEFDGPEHYSKVDHIDRDQRKLETATREGISIIRWPYYLQMSREVTAALYPDSPRYALELDPRTYRVALAGEMRRKMSDKTL